MRINPFFAWYDFWVGAYIDQENRRLYVLPVPCFGLMFSWPDEEGEYWNDWSTPCPGCTMMICGACGRPK